jgi:GT2 family glycosyltransferase
MANAEVKRKLNAFGNVCNVIDVGIVVPTLGTRIEYLAECLQSIRAAGPAFVLIVAPNAFELNNSLDRELYDLILADPARGLPAAIDFGINSLPTSVQYVNWLGDDDLLTNDSFKRTVDALTKDPKIALVYGGCEYIDANGSLLWRNRSGKFASPLLHFGPQLIPQPGALMRRDAYIATGGLNATYKWAFDLDLFIRLKKNGRLQFIDSTLAKFRWHEGSLSVGGRKGSVKEASQIRRSSLPKSLQFVSLLWEIPMKKVILAAGKRLNTKLTRLET